MFDLLIVLEGNIQVIDCRIKLEFNDDKYSKTSNNEYLMNNYESSIKNNSLKIISNYSSKK